MKLEITQAQAEKLRTEGVYVMEETHYFVEVGGKVRKATTEYIDPANTVAATKLRKRRMHSKTLVYGHRMLKRTGKDPKFHMQGISYNVWLAIREALPRTDSKVMRHELEEYAHALLPEYDALQVKKVVSWLLSKKILTAMKETDNAKA